MRIGSTSLRKVGGAGSLAFVTRTFAVAVFPFAVPVTVVSPSSTGVTSPVSSTTAIFGFAEVNFAPAVRSATVRPPSSSTSRSCCAVRGPVSGMSAG